MFIYNLELIKGGGQRTSFMLPPLKKADKPARMLHVGLKRNCTSKITGFKYSTYHPFKIP